MHDQTIPLCAGPSGEDEAAILSLLLAGEPPAWYSLDEIADEIGDRELVVQALSVLQSAGLVHRHCNFAFASVAARRMHSLTRLIALV